jgi:hypothetical protein
MDFSVDIPKLFWPDYLCKEEGSSGFLVGWNYSNFVYTVANVISGVSLPDLEELLSRYSAESDAFYTFMNEMCGAAPTILGLYVVSDEGDFEKVHQMVFEQRYDEWIIIKKIQGHSIPRIESIGHRGDIMNDIKCEIIFYEQPNSTKARYLSLEAIKLNFYEEWKNLEESEIPKDEKMYIQIEKHYLKHMAINDDSIKEDYIYYILNQINFASRLNQSLDMEHFHHISLNHQTDSHMNEIRILKEKLTHRHKENEWLFPNYPLEERSTCWKLREELIATFNIIKGFFLFLGIFTLFLIRCMTELIMTLSNFVLPEGFLNGNLVQEVSGLIRQMDLRLRQICLLPLQFVMLKRRGFRNTVVSRVYFIR